MIAVLRFSAHYLVEYLKLDQKLVARQCPHPYASICPTGDKVMLVWTTYHTVYLKHPQCVGKIKSQVSDNNAVPFIPTCLVYM